MGFRYWTDSFSVFSSLKSSVNCLNTKDKIFSPMDDDCPFLFTYNIKLILDCRSLELLVP